VKGKRVLIVDEVDDTRTTLAYSVGQIKKHEVEAVGIVVIHNKKKPKRSSLSSDVKYLVGEEIDDKWVLKVFILFIF
jgi:hypoxanthine phosphoribosyltransferase